MKKGKEGYSYKMINTVMATVMAKHLIIPAV